MDALDKLMVAVIELIPGATFETDNEGQVVIYTDLKLQKLFRTDGQEEYDLVAFEDLD